MSLALLPSKCLNEFITLYRIVPVHTFSSMLCTELTKFPLSFFYLYVSLTLEFAHRLIVVTVYNPHLLQLMVYTVQALDLVFSNISHLMVYMYCIRSTFKCFLIWFSLCRYNSHSVRLCTDTVATDFGIICQLENGQKSMSTITRRPVGKSI